MYTTKQRNKIYNRALECLPTTIDMGASYSMCKAICIAINWRVGLNCIEFEFPELMLFAESDDRTGYWYDFEDLESRKNVLSFCIAMTEQ